MPKHIDTDCTPWLFTAHDDGDFDEYFRTDHSKAVAGTAKEILAGLSESRDRLSGKLCYNMTYNNRRHKLTLLRFADIIVRADVTIKLIKSAFMKSEMENRELKKRIRELERMLSDE